MFLPRRAFDQVIVFGTGVLTRRVRCSQNLTIEAGRKHRAAIDVDYDTEYLRRTGGQAKPHGGPPDGRAVPFHFLEEMSVLKPMRRPWKPWARSSPSTGRSRPAMTGRAHGSRAVRGAR